MPEPFIKYPAEIDNNVTLPAAQDNATPVESLTVNRLRSAILALENTLGINPARTYGTVRSRLDAMENAITNGTAITFSGDLSGNQNSQTVIGLRGYSLQNISPVDKAVPVYNTTGIRYDIRKLSLDDIDPAFLINTFTGGSNVEVGSTVNNPAFNSTYSKSAVSANITNTENIDSPKNLSSPYTSGTVTGSFTKNTVNAFVKFTLTATGTAIKTADTYINYFARSFVGIGTAGATSATFSGNNATLVGATGTLNSHGLYSDVIGSTTATQSPTAQKIYFLCPHTTTPHTFKDQNGFGFPVNSPTTFNFTNQYGVIISMDLYESTNALSSPFSLTVVS